MTHIDYKVTGARVQLIIHGHAGYATEGSDIVCAGISTLTALMANLAKRYAEDGLIRDWMVQESGDMVHIFIDTGGRECIDCVVDTVYLMFKQLAEQYPRHVQLNILT